jgi:hypothetical protein
MFFGKSALQKALAKGISGKASFREALSGQDFTPNGARDVTAIKEALLAFELPATSRAFMSDLAPILMLLQSVEDLETRRQIRDDILPVVLGLVDEALATKLDVGWDMAVAAKIIAIYCTHDAFVRIPQLVTAYPEEFLWSSVFAIFEQDHPFAPRLLEALANPLPPGFAAVAFLDFANSRALEGVTERHPFDTEQGLARLESWLRSEDPETSSYAHSATVALAFVCDPRRSRALDIALTHPAHDVRLEAAWVMARVGSSAGLELLRASCGEVALSSKAQQYLIELGHSELVPAECTEPAFQARAELSSWLEHPAELGCAPSSVEVAGSWQLHWPPTADRRRLFVLRYETVDDVGKTVTGYGLVGSVTFALFGENEDLRPLEVLALHCCWELEQDSQLVGENDVENGLKLLVKANPELAREMPN